MAQAGDGRLELDELGTVIDHASSLDAPTRDDVLEGNDTVTWGERLESAGFTPWLRRHRVALAATTAVLMVAGVATGAYLRSRPPAQDMTVAVAVEDWAPLDGGGGLSGDGSGTLTAAYRALPLTAGTTTRILGIDGPGIRVSKADQRSDRPEDDGSSVADVVAVTGCDGQGLEEATIDDYRLRVLQTDAYGRSTAGTTPVPGLTAAQWVDAIVGPCVQQQVTERVVATNVRVSGDVARRGITAHVLLHNGYDHDLTLTPSTSGQSTAVFTVPDQTVVGPGEDGDAIVRMRVTDCNDPRLDDAYLPSDQPDNQVQVEGLSLQAQVSGLQSLYGAVVVAPFSREVARSVDALFDQICAGFPGTTTHVLSAGRSPAPSSELPTQGDPTMVGLRMTLDVATTAQRVTIADGLPPEDILNGAVATIGTAGAATSGGHARLTVDWAVTCSNFTNPPTVQLTLRSGSRSWPVRATLDDNILRDGYLALCPGLPVEELSGYGWPEA